TFSHARWLNWSVIVPSLRRLITPSSSLVPYTTLFRSSPVVVGRSAADEVGALHVGEREGVVPGGGVGGEGGGGLGLQQREGLAAVLAQQGLVLFGERAGGGAEADTALFGPELDARGAQFVEQAGQGLRGRVHGGSSPRFGPRGGPAEGGRGRRVRWLRSGRPVRGRRGPGR